MKKALDNPKAVSDQITEAGLTIKDASFLLGVHRQTLSKALKGEPVTDVVRYQILKKLPRLQKVLDSKTDDFEAMAEAKLLPNPRRETTDPRLLEAVQNFRRSLQKDPDLMPATFLRQAGYVHHLSDLAEALEQFRRDMKDEKSS